MDKTDLQALTIIIMLSAFALAFAMEASHLRKQLNAQTTLIKNVSQQLSDREPDIIIMPAPVELDSEDF